jgi:hypothetical protein
MSKPITYGKKYCSEVHFIRTSAHVRDYPVDAILPTDGKNLSMRMQF